MGERVVLLEGDYYTIKCIKKYIDQCEKHNRVIPEYVYYAVVLPPFYNEDSLLNCHGVVP